MRIAIIIAVVLVIIVGFYFYNKNKQAKIAADAQLATIAANAPPPPCTPFTKAQQDEQKKELNKICAKKQFIPVIGVFQFSSCLAKVDSQLTPLKEC